MYVEKAKLNRLQIFIEKLKRILKLKNRAQIIDITFKKIPYLCNEIILVFIYT